MLITDFNRSLGQGNIFTSVCHSVHRGGGWLPSRSHDQEVSIQGVSLQGGSASRGVGRLPQLGLRVGGAGVGQITLKIRGILSTRGRMHPTGMHSCFQERTYHFFLDVTTFQ